MDQVLRMAEGFDSVEDRYRELSPEERGILADIYESLWSGMERDEIKSKLLDHKDLLDVEITLWTSDVCAKPYFFEYHISREEHQEEQVKEYASLIRDGLCHCQSCSGAATTERSSSCLSRIAAATGEAWLVEFLLDQGCQPDPASWCYHYTPLWLAMERLNYDVVKILVQRAPDKLSQPTPEIGTWLHLAYNSLPIMKLVLGALKCDVNAYNSSDDTVLALAVRNGRLEEVRFLLENGADPNIPMQGVPVLQLAVRHVNKEMALALIKGGADVNAFQAGGRRTALYFSICRVSFEFCNDSKIEMTRLLLENGADQYLTYNGDPPLVLAARWNCTNHVELLIRHGADVNKAGVYGFTALHNCARDGYADLVKVLLENGAEPDKLTPCKNTPLAMAALGNQIDCLNVLLKHNVNVNNADKNGDTPMHYLAHNGNVEGLQALFDHGANPAVLNKFNASPLWNAIYMRHSEAVCFLAKQNVSLDIESCGSEQSHVDDTIPLYGEPRALLWVAAERQWVDGVTLLLQAGYNIWKEEWLLSGEDQGLSRKSRAISRHLRALAQKPPPLRLLCRETIRKAVTSDLQETVHQFPIAAILKDYLLLKNMKGRRIRVSLWDFTYDH